MQPAGLAIGLDSGKKFNKIIQLKSMKLASGDALVLFTDGLPEARNGNGEEFGEERLCQTLHSNQNLNAGEIKECILDEIMGFVGETPLHDDLTFIVMKIK